jgi:hypothetical protein
MPENDAQCVILVKRTSGGFVHVYKIIKQLYHACSRNSQNYCPEVLEMICEPLPSVLEMTWEQFSSHLQHLGTIVLTVP